jgi:hypothetical protein
MSKSELVRRSIFEIRVLTQEMHLNWDQPTKLN